MACFSTEPASERRNPTGKDRVRDVFPLSSKTNPANRRQPAQPRRKIRPTATKSVSGIPYWPSRDPIGENGGENLYGFVYNDSNTWIDYLGREPQHGVPPANQGPGQYQPNNTFPVTGNVQTTGNNPAPSLPSGRGQGASGAMSGVQSLLNSVADAASRAGAEMKCKELKSTATATACKDDCNSCIVVIGNHNVMQGGAASPRFSVLLSESYYACKKCSDHDLSPKTEPGFTQGPDNSFTDTEMIKKYGDGSLVNPVKQSPYCLSL